MSRRFILPQRFFSRPALTVARDLLGKFLVRRLGRRTVPVMITEVEAYVGPQDRACHASQGKTKRNAVMFGPPGRFYVYFCYGMHWMLNVVTGPEGYPAAVLIRGGRGLRGGRAGVRLDGPGKLTKELRIAGGLNGGMVGPRSRLWVEDRGVRLPSSAIERTPRIGVDYAGPWSRKLYRFVLREHPGARSRSPDAVPSDRCRDRRSP